MAAEFQTQMQLMAEAIQRSLQIQEGNALEHQKLLQTLQASSSSAVGSGERKRDIKPLPSHYVYSATPSESFNDHIERLKCIKSLQGLNEDDFIKLFKSSLSGQALRVASAIDETSFLGKLNGSRDYIESLEKLFVSAQQNRTFRLDFANLKQKKDQTILEFYANLLYLARSAKITNIDNSVACKDKFIDGIRNVQIKRKLLEQGEFEKESLQSLMSRAANLEAIDKNLTSPRSSSTSGMNDDSSEPMEIGSLHWRKNSGYGPPPRPNWYFQHRPAMPPPRRGLPGPQGYGGNRFIPTRRPWNIYGSGPSGFGSGPSGPPPPQGNNRGRFISPRHGSGPSGFGSGPNRYRSGPSGPRRDNATPPHGRQRGSLANANKTFGNAFKDGPHWRNNTKRYSVQNIELKEEQEEGDIEGDTGGGNAPTTPQYSDTPYIQTDQDYEHYGNQHYDYSWHDPQLLEDAHWQDQYQQYGHDSFAHNHDTFLE